MDTFPDLRHHALQLIQFTLELCVLTLKNSLNQNNPLLMSVWSEQETADLVDYLYHRRGEGSFLPGTFHDLAVYLNRKYPGSDRSRNSVLSKFGTLKDDIAIIDRYNSVHVGEPDPSVVFVADEARFVTYLSTSTARDRNILETYCHTPFPNYAKLKAILQCIESTALGFPSCGGNNAISLPAPTPLSTQPSKPFVYSDSATSSAMTTSSFPLTSYPQPSFSVCAPSSPLPSHPFQPLSSAVQMLPPPCGPQPDPHAPSHVSAVHFPLASSDALGIQQASESFQPWHLPSSSAFTSQVAIQQSTYGPQPEHLPLPAASFYALEHGQTRNAFQQSTGDRRQLESQPVLTIPFSFSSQHLTSPSPDSGCRRTDSATRCSVRSRQSDLHHVALSSPRSSAGNGSDRGFYSVQVDMLARLQETVETVTEMLQQSQRPTLVSGSMTSDTLATIKASKALSASRALSDAQKAQLFEYFCDNPVVAYALPENNDSFCDAIFQEILCQ